MSGITMRWNPDDVWPDDPEPGTFDILPCSLAGRTVTARIAFTCPNRKHCGAFMAPTPEQRPTPDEPFVWGWDGDTRRPTLTPSIDCKGCWHGHITAGVMTNA